MIVHLASVIIVYLLRTVITKLDKRLFCGWYHLWCYFIFLMTV